MVHVVCVVGVVVVPGLFVVELYVVACSSLLHVRQDTVQEACILVRDV